MAIRLHLRTASALPYTALDTLLSHCLVSSTALSVNTHLLPPTCTHRTPHLYGSGRISRRGGTGKLKYISREPKLDRLTFHYKLEGSVQIGCSLRYSFLHPVGF